MPTPIDLKGSIKIAQKALRDNKIIEAREICKSILLHFPHNKKAKDLLSKLDGDTFIEKFDPPKEQQQQLIDLYDQGQLGSCTANAIAFAYEFDLFAFVAYADNHCI